MATYQIVSAGGSVLDLSDYADRVALAGSGMPEIGQQIDSHQDQQGATVRGFSLSPRRMNLTLTFAPSSDALADGKRDDLYGLFQPTQKEIRLRVTRDDGAQREIYCHVDGEIDMPESRRVGTLHMFTVPLLAPDPIWHRAIFGSSVTATALNTWATADLSDSSWRVYPNIIMTGPINSGVASFQNAGVDVEFEDLTAGQTVTIKLAPRATPVVQWSGGGTNVFDTSKLKSSFFDLHRIHLRRSDSGGNDAVKFNGTGTSGATQLYVSYQWAYLGL